MSRDQDPKTVCPHCNRPYPTLRRAKSAAVDIEALLRLDTAAMSDAALHAHYARTAPLLDLRFYLSRVDNDRDRFGPDTECAVEAMRQLEPAILDGTAGTTAHQKRAVWAAIQRYKSSIPRWWAGRPDVAAATESEAAA